MADKCRLLGRYREVGADWQYCTRIESRIYTLVVPANSSSLLKRAWKKDWIVYAKKPFAGPEPWAPR